MDEQATEIALWFWHQIWHRFWNNDSQALSAEMSAGPELPTLITLVAVVAGSLALRRLRSISAVHYRLAMTGDNTLWKRYPTAGHMTPDDLRKPLRLRGIVTSVGDSDGCRVYHRPTLRSLGKLPERITSADTISVRLAGVDCPEAAHFGMTAQPYSFEAYAFTMACLIPKAVLKPSSKYLVGNPKNKHLNQPNDKPAKLTRADDKAHGRKTPPRGVDVLLEIHRKDQYDRAVAMVYYRPYKLLPFYYRNLSTELLKRGLAVIYEQAGAEYGIHLAEFQRVEARAKKAKRGMWAQSKSAFTSPADFKKAQKTT